MAEIRLVADPGFARAFSEVLDLLGVSLPDQPAKWKTNKPLDKASEESAPHGLRRQTASQVAVIDNKTVITGASTGRPLLLTPTMKPCWSFIHPNSPNTSPTDDPSGTLLH